MPKQEATLDGASIVGGQLIASYLADAKTEVRVHDLGPEALARSSFRASAQPPALAGDMDDPETFFAFTSFNRPTTIYRYDARSGQASTWAAPKVAFNPDDFGRAALLRFEGRHASADVHRPQEGNRAGPAPTLLYGYGGFNVSLTPGFSADARWPGWKRAASMRSPTSAAAANMARRGTMPAGSPTSRTCSTISSPPANI